MSNTRDCLIRQALITIPFFKTSPLTIDVAYTKFRCDILLRLIFHSKICIEHTMYL